MKVKVGNNHMRDVSFADDRYVDIISMDGSISIRVIIEKDQVVITARSGSMVIEHDRAYPSVRVEKKV